MPHSTTSTTHSRRKGEYHTRDVEGATTFAVANGRVKALCLETLSAAHEWERPGGLMFITVSLPSTTAVGLAFEANSTVNSLPTRALQSDVREVVFVDPSVADLDVLLKSMRSDIAVWLLTPTEPAPLQMARFLAGHADIDVIHIIAHGQPGEVCFGVGALSLGTIEEHRGDLAAIGRALAADGEIRLWACNAARGQRGVSFLDGLRMATGANVLGASGLVGAAACGARWELDASADGTARPPLTEEGIANYAGVMTNVTATTGTDNPTLSSSADTVIVTDSNQIQAADKF